MTVYFPEIDKIVYEGRKTDNPLAFRYYDPNKVIGDKTMEEHLRFSMAYWHTLTGQGVDMFGAASVERPWDKSSDPMEAAKARAHAAFEFMEKMQIPYFCFHDVDVAPEGATLTETFNNLDKMAELLKELMAKTGKKLLWGTSNLFSHPRFMHAQQPPPAQMSLPTQLPR